MQTQALAEDVSAGGPSASESGGNPRLSDSNIQERNASKLLRAVVKKHNVVSTTSLVAAYNATTVTKERAVLLNWLLKYSEAKEDSLKPKSVLEYSELARVDHVSEQDAKALRNLVYDLGSRIHPDEFLDENVAKALLSALTWVDATVYDDLAQLIVLAKKLLFSLSSEPRLNKHNFAKYEPNFLALHRVFFLLQSIGRGYVLEKEKRDLRQAVAQKRDLMELSVLYYPVFFHFELIQQAVERLEIEDAPSRLTKAARYTTSGLYGGMHVFHCLRKLAGGDIDPASIEDAYRKGRAAIAKAGVLEQEWYDILQILTAARISALKEEKKHELLALAYDTAMEGQRKATRGNNQKALRFGIVQEMRLLASDEGSSQDGRKKATIKLVELATNQAILENWICDADILTAIFEALYAIHKMGEQNEETAEAFEKIKQSCDEPAKETFTAWLDGNTVDEKLKVQRQEQADDEHEDLFAKTGAAVRYLHPHTIRSNTEDLKETYLNDNFATVPSLFEPEDRRHVKYMEYHVVAYEEITEKRILDKTRKQHKDEEEETGGESSARKDEDKEMGVESSTINKRDDPREYCEQKKRVTTPISIEDLFKPRSLQAGVGKNDIRRVLLYGNPGSGKTCISKAIAHKWAMGEILQELEAVYVVPIRRLNLAKAKGGRGEAIEEVVARMCFKQKGSDDEFEKLKTQINDDLDMSSTLLVFDGLDEADDDARDFLSEAEKGECKLLILTRPYNLRGIQTRVDCRFECLGFNDQQLERYINKELQHDEASRLVHALRQNRGMWETAHTPVTAHILCSLSKAHGTSIEYRGERASMFRIYGNMANFVWERFKERPEARMANKDTVFGDLEKIAFEALRSGQILIEERIVKSQTTSTNTTKIFKESGFLLLILEGQQYQFPHLTFQEYFAGRFIANSLKSRGSDEESRVLNFIQAEKYNQKHELTMHFAVNAFAKSRREDALHEMLSIIDDQPVEVLGIQHSLLRMRVLEAVLEETEENVLEDLLNDKQATKLAESARQLLKCTIKDDLIREIVVKELQKLSRILEGFPQVLNDIVDEVKILLACKHDLTDMEMAKITDDLKLARHSPKHSYEVTQFILRLEREVNNWCNSRECMKRIESVALQVPQHAGEILPTLAKFCDDDTQIVRNYALEAIGRVVAAAPHLAGEFLSTLSKGCDDENENVRKNALKAIGRVVVAAPQHAGEFLPTLSKGREDENENVRKNALKAIGRVVAAAPQHAGEFLPTLSKGCEDDIGMVREHALEAIGRVVAAAPHLAGEHLPTLAEGCDDVDRIVRVYALEAIGRVVAAAPHHAGEFLPTLSKGCDDADRIVRKNALKAIGRVVAAAPQHAGEFLPTLSKGCEDDIGMVREHALEAIGRVVAAAPHLAGEHLPTLAEGCDDVDRIVRVYALEAIGRVVAAAPHHAGEFLPTLSKGCDDADRIVRKNALKAIGRVVAAAPQHAGEFLPTLAEGCADVDRIVREYALEAIGRVVAAAPQHAGEFLSTLEEGCDDADWIVREHALEAIGRVVEAAPHHAGEFLPTLSKGCDDADRIVRKNALKAIGRVVVAAPQHAGEFLPTLLKGCDDDIGIVRKNALETIGRVVAAAPQHTGEFLPTVSKACNDSFWIVRKNALEAIGRVVAAAPHLAGEYLPTLSKACDDGFWMVRENALEAIGRVVAAAPHLADEYLPTLSKGCDDENENVRDAARTLLKAIKAERVIPSSLMSLSTYKGGLSFFFVQNSFTVDILTRSDTALLVMHTISSQEIGRCEKKSIEQFLWYLRREFEEKFPGLVNKLGMSELVLTVSKRPRKLQWWQRFRI